MSLGPIKVTRVTRDVYCVQRVKMLSCSYFVLQSDGVVLIDAGMDVDAADMTAGLQEVSCSLQDVKALLITHWHNDHPQGAGPIQDAWPDVRIYATQSTADLLDSDAMQGMGFEPSPEYEASVTAQIDQALEKNTRSLRQSGSLSLRSR